MSIDTHVNDQQTSASPHIQLLYPIALLTEPRLGAPALALLPAGSCLQSHHRTQGFLSVQGANGDEGFIPTAMCAPLAMGNTDRPPITFASRSVALHRNPAVGSQYTVAPDRWFISPGEPLLVLRQKNDSLQVRRQDGQVGTIPSNICGPLQARGFHHITHVTQPILLHRTRSTIGQFIWVTTNEQLLLLGYDNGFALIQRDNGQLGYIPSSFCRSSPIDTISQYGKVDLGWIVIGGGWMVLNWIGVAIFIEGFSSVVGPFKPYIGLGIVLAVAFLLWMSHRRLIARSFAIGIILAYALLHLISGGWITLWQ